MKRILKDGCDGRSREGLIKLEERIRVEHMKERREG